ncbi:MAG: dynamin, partial [Actinomycetota bacterium]
LGGKAMRDERTRLLTARRNQASAAVRQYVDQVTTRGRKELRASIRNDQRAIREHLAEHAEQLVKSAEAALVKARQSAQADSTTRTKRRSDVAAEVRRIRDLKAKVDTVLGEEGTGHD